MTASQSSQTVLVRYVYVDIVGYTLGRSVEAQVKITESLNRCINQTVAAFDVDSSKIIYLPTGDGVCICLLDHADPLDFDIRISIMLMEKIHSLWLAESDEESRFAIRIGLNENHDNMVYDIGGKRRNFVGMGVNNAHRLMTLAAPFQILMGPAVFQRLTQRRLYKPNLYALHGIVKHGEKVLCYGYHDPGLACFASMAHHRRQQSGKDSEESPPASRQPLQLPLDSQGKPVRRRQDRQAKHSFKL